MYLRSCIFITNLRHVVLGLHTQCKPFPVHWISAVIWHFPEDWKNWKSETSREFKANNLAPHKKHTEENHSSPSRMQATSAPCSGLAWRRSSCSACDYPPAPGTREANCASARLLRSTAQRPAKPRELRTPTRRSRGENLSSRDTPHSSKRFSC